MERSSLSRVTPPANWLGLGWAQPALLGSVNEARQALQQFVAAPQHAAVLSNAVAPLQQVRGALRMLEVPGTARLVEALLAVAQALQDGLLPGRGAPVSALTQGLDALPGHLEHVRETQVESAQGLLDLINPLYRCLGREPLGASSLTLAAPSGPAPAGVPLTLDLNTDAAPDRDALRSVLRALCDDLGRLQGRLVWVPEQSRAASVADWTGSLRHIADTLAVLGFQQPRRVILDQVLALQGWAEDSAGDASLIDIVGALQYVQAALQGMLGTGETAAAEPGPMPDAEADELLDIFRSEALEHLADVDAWLEQAQRPPAAISDALQRALHTLKGSAGMAGVQPVSSLAAAFDRMLREYKGRHWALEAPEVALLQQASAVLHQGLDAEPLQVSQADVAPLIDATHAQLDARLADDTDTSPTRPDAQRTASFLQAGMDHLMDAEDRLDAWQAQPRQGEHLQAVLDAYTALGEAAHLAELWEVDGLCEALLDLYGAVEEGSLPADAGFFALVRQGHEALLDLFDQLAAGQDRSPPTRCLEALRAGIERALAPDSLGHLGAEGITVLDSEVIEHGPVDQVADEAETPADRELRDVFLEESSDLVESAGASLARWQADPRNAAEVDNLLRDLHTLKGGARMVEEAAIGDLAHELEFLYELLAAGRLPASAALFSLLQNCHDRLAHMLDAVRLGEPLHAATALIDYIRNFSSAALTDSAAGATPQTAQIVDVHADTPAATPERAAGEMVKVDAELLDDLGNLASEHALVRGRIEQQVNDAQFALNEMHTTLERMRDQLLRLDSETHARLGGRSVTEGDAYEDFDPLEMDRHSTLHQLSRGLFESASDLIELKETLDQQAQQTHALLQQQARLNSQLQEGLTATLMVPFERLVPRLQRVVRQVASELGKQVELVVGNAEGELDRSVLERMVAPLEHMLRNAVDHGLESREVRLAAGKPEQGTIHLNLLHEGADIVIEMSDDGAGVPLQAVRDKAIKRGLLNPKARLSDHEVLQFILRPGFSTAQKITQISGRGLGMDVVHEEVKQLGGSMSIESSAGKGARFMIRLPFSVSLNRAMIVHVGEAQYAVALSSLEGIVRVPPAELAACYEQSPARYRYGGQTYALHYLGELLQEVERPTLLGQHVPLPVLLVHGQERAFAIQVDNLSPSREIVVKSLGPQFAAVPGLAGATLLGDGRVVLILDLLGQLQGRRRRLARLPAGEGLVGSVPRRARLVMVVDDSVTVRKVTSRLLERHGMNVLTAKDGVDAMALLEEHRPDVLLLDIEMPRMDGFEVAMRVRQDPRLADLPIIMITSRTGQKHRDRAMAIGVNAYLGKPYHDALLLQSIADWSPDHA